MVSVVPQKHPFKPLVTSCEVTVIRVHEDKKVKMQIFTHIFCIPCKHTNSWSAFRGKLEIEKVPKSTGITWKVTFWTFKMAKLCRFHHVDFKLCIITYQQSSFFSYCFFCWNSKFAGKNLYAKKKIILSAFEILKLIIRDNSMIFPFNLHLFMKTNRFSVKNCNFDNDFRTSSFFTKIGRTWRHSDFIDGRLKTSKHSFGRENA